MLTEHLLPPPLPALVAVGLALGIAGVARRLARRSGGEDDPLREAGALVVVVAAITWAAHGLAWAGVALVPALRVMGGGLCAVGLFDAYNLARGARGSLGAATARLRTLGTVEKVAAALVIALLVTMGLLAIAPVTDPDSTGYHLAAPQAWLEAGHALSDPAYYQMRLLGLGDMLSLLGLACGTDSLGACTQLFGIAVGFQLVRHAAETPERCILGQLLVVALPVLIAVVPSQKPQLFQATGVVLACVLAAEERVLVGFDRLVIGVALAFAIGTKHSFVITCAPVGVLALVILVKRRQLVRGLVEIGGVAALVLAPILARRVLAYGDPFSPMLEGLRKTPDPLLKHWAAYLRDTASDHSLRGMLMLPIRLVVPQEYFQIQHSLGVGAVAGILALPARGALAKRCLIVAAAAAILLAFLAQHGARFVLEPYFLAVIALLRAPLTSRAPRWLLYPLVLQGLVVLASEALGVYLLTPGAVTARLRDRVWSNTAQGYVESVWLDAVLAPDDVIVTHMRAYSFLPRPYVAFDGWTEMGDPALAEPLRHELVSLARSKGATVFVFAMYAGSGPIAESHPLSGCLAPVPPITNTFGLVTRNPFRSDTARFDFFVYRLDLAQPSCGAP